MPITFLRQLIRFYGDQMQMVVPAYLEQSMAAFQREQESFRGTAANPADDGDPGPPQHGDVPRGDGRLQPVHGQCAGRRGRCSKGAGKPAAPAAPAPSQDDLSAMREQLAEMQRRLEALDAKKS